eukprot:322264_1
MQKFGCSSDSKLYAKQFNIIKAILFALREKGLIMKYFNVNKKEYKTKIGPEITIHNEITRILLRTEKLCEQIPDVMGMVIRFEMWGCAEGGNEGEVREGNNRIKNRDNLKPQKFGEEHTIKQILRLFYYDSDSIKQEVAGKLYDKYGDVFFKDMTRVNPNHFPSKHIGKMTNPPDIKNIDNELHKMDLPDFQSIGVLEETQLLQ